MEEQVEVEKSEFKAKRLKELGFVPQKEIPANRLLPVSGLLIFFIHLEIVYAITIFPSNWQYADKLDKESNEMLLSIKNNLAKCVALRDIKPGVTLMLHELSK